MELDPNKKNRQSILNQKINYGLDTPNWEGKTILVAEDDDVSFQFVEEILSETHVNIIRCNNGEKAVNYCKENGCSELDIVIMDMEMPAKDGYKATREIREICPDLPIIAQTSFTDIGDKEKTLSAGCDLYISKPIIPKKFLAGIKKFIEKT